jgi:hypothetical protein
VAEKQYQRLTRPAAYSSGRIIVALSWRQSLWFAQDHLLSIRSNRFVEEYRRFYFRDIQAITIRKTRRREFWNIVLSLVFAPSLGLFMMRMVQFGFSSNLWPWFVLFGFVGLPLLFNNLLGPTCTCYMRTAVQVEELPSMNRLRKAQKILTRIRPLIATAQGELTAAQLSSGMQELAQAAAATEASRRFVTSPLNLS